MQNAVNDVTKFMRIGGQKTPDRLIDLADLRIEFATNIGEIANLLFAAQRRVEALDADNDVEKLVKLRARLMISELAETLQALGSFDIIEVADGLVDLDYVTIGSAVAFGLPHAEAWDEVQRSNLGKFLDCPNCDGAGSPASIQAMCMTCEGHGKIATKDEGGKILKPIGWTPPDIAAVVRRAQTK